MKSVKLASIVPAALILILSAAVSVQAAPVSPAAQSGWSYGMELDALPFATGGYYVSGWAGKGPLRIRGVYSDVTVPNLVVPDGFNDWKLTAAALIVDYFPKWKGSYEGPWVGAGIEQWDSSIRPDGSIVRGDFRGNVLTVGGGYVYRFNEHLYINPWIAGHLRSGGDSRVIIDGKELNVPDFSPELSVKLGWSF